MKRLILLALVLVAGSLNAQALIDEAHLKALLASDKSTVVLDVRTAEEYAAGHLPGAKLLPFDQITANTAAPAIPSKTSKVVVYCRSGRRSALAAQTLKQLGYTAVWDFAAVSNWKGPLVKP